MPWHDWQFWVVSAAAAWGAWVLMRQAWPRQEGPPCGGCAAGAAACAKKPATEEGGQLVQLGGRR